MRRLERFLGKAFGLNVFSVAMYLNMHGRIDLNAYLFISIGSLLGLIIYEVVKKHNYFCYQIKR